MSKRKTPESSLKTEFDSSTKKLRRRKDRGCLPPGNSFFEKLALEHKIDNFDYSFVLHSPVVAEILLTLLTQTLEDARGIVFVCKFYYQLSRPLILNFYGCWNTKIFIYRRQALDVPLDFYFFGFYDPTLHKLWKTNRQGDHFFVDDDGSGQCWNYLFSAPPILKSIDFDSFDSDFCIEPIEYFAGFKDALSWFMPSTIDNEHEKFIGKNHFKVITYVPIPVITRRSRKVN